MNPMVMCEEEESEGIVRVVAIHKKQSSTSFCFCLHLLMEILDVFNPNLAIGPALF